MSDIITAITIKNMAREMVRKATAKNDKMSRQEYQRRYEELKKQFWQTGSLTTKEYNDKLDKLKAEYKKSNVANADEPKFDGEGFLLDKNGKPFFVYNGTTADLIIRKYKAMGVNLTAVRDRTGDVYFKRA